MLCGLQMKLKGMTNESAKEIWYLKMYLEETEETLSVCNIHVVHVLVVYIDWF